MNDTSAPTIFVVDDDDAVRDSLRDLIDSVGLDVATYPSAHAFLDVYDNARRGCLVLDIRMPGMSGLELQERLNERGSSLPIVFITGHGDVPMAVEAMKRGAVDFIQKPFRDQELLDRINLAIEQNRRRREAEETKQDIAERVSLPHPARAGGDGHGHPGKGEQGHRHRSRLEPAHGRSAPRPRDGQDEGPDAGRAGEDEHHPGRVNPRAGTAPVTASEVP